MRKITHLVKIGNINIGGNNPVVVQSMTDTDTSDINKTVTQIEELYNDKVRNLINIIYKAFHMYLDINYNFKVFNL